MSPAYAQVEMPWMIQSASLFGLWAITFVVALFAAAAAMFAVTRQIVFAVVAVGVVALNLGFGAWRIAAAPQTPLIAVGLAADDDLVRLRFKEDPASALKVVKAYAAAGRTLAREKATLIVFPERIAVLKPEWRGVVNAELATLAGPAVAIAGFDDRSTPRRNVALIYLAGGGEPQRYAKRHLVPGLEAIFVPGDASFMTSDGLGVAICKDMDFPAMVRRDGVFAPSLYGVPAWDFGKDGVWHARLAILRGVENGFAVARAANNGLLTVSDAYGRVVAVKSTAGGGMVTVRADVQRGPGTTDYARTGDDLAWIALAMSVLLLGVAVAAAKRPV
jgi:apolipoprotein N-acyltransferase